ncbi:MAG: hypothetical protein IJ398_01315 [Clostridia bacterium]|nr:hypothetical protein [Clostridia bacterium]
MFITKKRLLEIEARISALEDKIKEKSVSNDTGNENEASYKEVIDEWFNGKAKA